MVSTLPDPLPTYKFQRAGAYEPPAEYEWLRAERPVAQVKLSNGNIAWLLTRYEDSRAALADPRLSAEQMHVAFNEPWEERTKARHHTPGHFITMDSPRHDVIRRMLTPFFTARRIDAMRPDVEQVVDELIDNMLAGPKPADLAETFAFQLSTIVIYRMLGVPHGDYSFFAHRSTGYRDDVADDEQRARAKLAGDEQRAYLERLVRQKSEQPGDDIISSLVERMRAGELTETEVVSISNLLIGAGSDTTANMIGLGMLTLFEHPDVLERLRANPEIAPQVVEELLRYLSIVELSTASRRVALEDVEIGGQLIRKGEGVLPSIMSGNRDDRVFPNPDVLDIDRAKHEHLAFSHGIHFCLGAPLARLELQQAFTSLTQRVPTMQLAVPAGEVPLRHNMLVFGVERLPVTW